ncbi:hypothetical protein BDP81DRAFT_418016 [Colletotrichum phormii]|uniref:Uncharacterized protein n=1 Tax=Colletotrichum phormii TaxID=359342 RepID=A0AAI9ZZJ5_9PEZI|nr:uncharacterized protein BDP81DRAFT_418016 [Colletotrichum phormii]KAK1641083.1 hypothetical protein BDP81DRAFT_418016 [Colletotrichum phormii]
MYCLFLPAARRENRRPPVLYLKPPARCLRRLRESHHERMCSLGPSLVCRILRDRFLQQDHIR